MTKGSGTGRHHPGVVAAVLSRHGAVARRHGRRHAGPPSVIMSPIAFLQKPARWMQQLAGNPCSFTAGPNFAFELASRRTTDDDMAGLDLGGVHTILSGSERIHAATIRRFTERFARFNLPANALAPSYGLAEAMVYVASAPRAHRPVTVRLDYEKLVAGTAEVSPPEPTWSASAPRAPARCGSSTPTPAPRTPPARSGRSGYTEPTSPAATGTTRRPPNAPSADASTPRARAHRRDRGCAPGISGHPRGRTAGRRPYQRPADRRRPKPLPR